MMTKKEIEEMEDKIHSMSVAELKEMVKKVEFVPVNIDPSELPEEEPEPEWVDTIQSMSVAELKEVFKNGNSITVGELLAEDDSPILKEKVHKTGLSQVVIQQIETNKYKATLEEIIAYCKGLKISYQDFLPELFR
ncbi:MAG: helix-turn-helix transcriptional regulator [Bacteroidota bacterium]